MSSLVRWRTSVIPAVMQPDSGSTTCEWEREHVLRGAKTRRSVTAWRSIEVRNSLKTLSRCMNVDVVARNTDKLRKDHSDILNTFPRSP